MTTPWLSDTSEGRQVLSLYKGLITLEPSVKSRMYQITEQVAERHGLTVPNLRLRTRQRVHAWPRQEAYAIIRAITGASYPRIGRFFGGRDHTTILKGHRAYLKRMAKTAGNHPREIATIHNPKNHSNSIGGMVSP